MALTPFKIKLNCQTQARNQRVGEVAIITLLAIILSCGLKDQETLTAPIIPAQNIDTSSLLFTYTNPSEPSFLGFHVMYKFFQQTSATSEANLSNLVETFSDENPPTPQTLQSSYGFFPITPVENNAQYKPSIPFTQANILDDDTVVSIEFTELLDDFLQIGLDLDDIEEPFFYLKNQGAQKILSLDEATVKYLFIEESLIPILVYCIRLRISMKQL
jgi:hypothetical protein